MFEIEQKARNVHVVKFELETTDDEQWIQLSADRHFDAVQCDRALMKRHLDQAVERNAAIIDVGDMFDIMQGKYDPRKSYDELRDEYKGDNYLDLVLQDASEFFVPYARHFAVIAMGNHETELERRMGTNMIDRLVHELRRDGGSQVVASGYTGYVILHFTVNKTRRSRVVLKYHHGMGSNAPVTRGVISSNRMAVMFPDADIIVSGHNHESWSVPIQQEKIKLSGKLTMRPQWHIRVPSYKNGWGHDQIKGFDVEKGSPKPRGCVWLRFYAHQNSVAFDPMQSVV